MPLPPACGCWRLLETSTTCLGSSSSSAGAAEVRWCSLAEPQPLPGARVGPPEVALQIHAAVLSDPDPVAPQRAAGSFASAGESLGQPAGVVPDALPVCRPAGVG